MSTKQKSQNREKELEANIILLTKNLANNQKLLEEKTNIYSIFFYKFFS